MTTITVPLPTSMTTRTRATDPSIAAAATAARATARTAVADLLNDLCADLGIDPWEAWHRPAHHDRIDRFRAAIRPLHARKAA